MDVGDSSLVSMHGRPLPNSHPDIPERYFVMDGGV